MLETENFPLMLDLGRVVSLVCSARSSAARRPEHQIRRSRPQIPPDRCGKRLRSGSGPHETHFNSEVIIQ